LQLGVPPGSGVGIYSINCKEWALFDAAAHAYGMVSVPLYDTLGPDAVEYICNHAELACVGCSAAVLPVLLGCLARCPTVRLVVVWGDAPAAPGATAASSSASSASSRLPLELPPGVHPDVRLVTIEACESLGRRHPRAHLPPRPSDVATLCYTSGTTGTPKGAVLTHANLIADSAGTSLLLKDWSPGDRHISYLPLAHIYERCNLVMCVHLGASVGFYSGDVTQLLDDVQVLKPTLFASVPRLWNRIYDRVMAGVREGSPIARALFNRAYAAKRAALEQGGDLSGGRMGAFWDRLVFSKVAAKLGGNVKYMTTGASPISAEVMAFLRVCFPGAKVLEGYGMTESSCTICLTREDDPTVGHVGAPLPCCEVKLVDIPEMNYLTTDSPHPRGEVCVRGPTVFQGYYKQPEQTRECLDDDGWLHTGDVGCWLPGGRLRIIDRKKNIFKLAQGEYVAPEKIEGVYTRSPFVLQAFVHGDSLRSQLVALVVPDPDYLLPWARERGLPPNLPALCSDPTVLSAVRKSMAEEARAAQLRGFEVVAAVALAPEPFSVENGLLTPTMKTKRNEARDRFRAVLDGLYAQLPEGGGGGGGNGEAA
jgi:long-chain acyl-CoA synthetase